MYNNNYYNNSKYIDSTTKKYFCTLYLLIFFILVKIFVNYNIIIIANYILLLYVFDRQQCKKNHK